ncbi:MAG: serine hydrolase, partial [Gemmatimonadota bacterium]
MHRLTRVATIPAISTALAILGPSFAFSQDPSGDWRSDVQGFAHRLLDAGLTPGMGIAVTRGDSVVYADGFGVADKATGREVDEDTAFYIASSTKALTATAVVLLAE